MQSRGKIIRSFLILALIASFFLFSCSKGDGGYVENDIVSVLADENGSITVRARLDDATVESVGENGRIYLFALMPGESVSGIGEMTPVAEKRAASDIEFTLDKNSASIPLLYAKYVLAAVKGGSYTVVSPAAYVENPQVFAKASYGSKPLSKKGLAGVTAAEAEELFVSQTVIDVPVDVMLDCSHGGERCGIGVDTYKVCAERVALLDHQIRTFGDAGITVYLRFIINSDSSAERALPLAAVTSFLCERYGDSVGDVILAFDLGAPVCDVHTTAALFRAFNTAAVSSNSAINAYFSVSCVFNTSEGGGSRVLLTDLFTALAYNGEIPFGIALDMSAARYLDAQVWNDKEPTSELSSAYVTVRNLEIIADFLHGEEFLYNGVQRKLLVTDFAVRTDGDNAEDVQATSIAYGYYKAVSVDSVVGIIYDSCEDGSESVGLRGENAKKKSYSVFAALNTDDAPSVTAFALKLIGVNRWAAVIGSFEVPEAAYGREYLKLEYDAKSELKEETAFDFSRGEAHGFYPSDNASVLEMLRDDDSFSLSCKLDSEFAGYGGVSAAIADAFPEKTREIVIDCEIKGAENGADVPVRVVLKATEDGVEHTWYADGMVKQGSRVSLRVDVSKIGSLRGELGRMKLLVDSENTDTELLVHGISYRYKPVSVFLVIIFVILGLAAAFGGFVLFLYLRMLYYRRKRRLRKEKMQAAKKNAGAKPQPQTNKKPHPKQTK